MGQAVFKITWVWQSLQRREASRIDTLNALFLPRLFLHGLYSLSPGRLPKIIGFFRNTRRHFEPNSRHATTNLRKNWAHP